MNDIENYTTGIVISIICWITTAWLTGRAVIAACFEDTLLERIALSFVSIASVGAAWRAFAHASETPGGVTVAVAVLFLAMAFIGKLRRGCKGERYYRDQRRAVK